MTNKSIRDYINLIENAQREEVSESIGQEALRKDREAKAEWIKNNPLMKDKNPVQQQAAWAIYSTFHKPNADKKKEEGVTEDGIESWSGNPSDRRHSGHESYMTPEYMLAHYKERLAQIAAGKHKYPKEVAQLQAKIAKLEKQVASESSLEEYGDTPKGQKMLDKVHHRAVDRVTSKKSDMDPKYAKKNQDTANAAWERMKDKQVEESSPDAVAKVEQLFRHK